MKKQISIIIADDHVLFRDGLATLLSKQNGIILVAEASNGEQVIQLAGLHRPDIIFMDIKMPVMDGIEATRIISEKFPEIGIIALSMFDGDYLVAEMLETGADGYMLKGAGKQEIIEAIRAVSERKQYFCKTVTAKLARALAGNTIVGNPLGSKVFSQKEKMIIRLMCEGFSAREIAKKLNLSMRTIEGYKERLLEKTGSRNSSAFIVFVMENNIYKT